MSKGSPPAGTCQGQQEGTLSLGLRVSHTRALLLLTATCSAGVLGIILQRFLMLFSPDPPSLFQAEGSALYLTLF